MSGGRQKKGLEPLASSDPELATWFASEAERARVASDVAAQARVWHAVSERLLAAPMGPQPDLDMGPWAVAKHVASKKVLAWVTAAFVTGGAAGAVVQKQWDVAHPRPMKVAQTGQARALRAVAQDTALHDAHDAFVEPLAMQEATATEPRPVRTAAQAPKPAVAPMQTGENEAQALSTLSHERALIDVARAALEHGNVDDAFAALGRHARMFPQGALQEERDALRILALSRSGAYGKAQEAAEAFGARYPRSVFSRMVEEAVRR